MGDPPFLLLHSPLLGPTTWGPLADELARRGRQVILPDLRPAATTGRIEAVLDLASIYDGSEPPIVVGHSGGGFLVPFVVTRLEAACGVFVDAGVPVCRGPASPSGDFLVHLRGLAVDGMLPGWSTWWPAGVLEELVPDRDLRAELVAQQPTVPLALYETAILVPPDWCDRDLAYLQLSDAYESDAAAARARGWRAVERTGGHLDHMTRPSEIADDVLRLVS